MSTIPKGSSDNYSKHVKKLDKNGNQKPHPRLSKKTPMEKMLDYEASLAPSKPTAPVLSKKPKLSKTEKAAGKIGEALGAAKKYFVGETYDKAHKKYLKKRGSY